MARIPYLPLDQMPEKTREMLDRSPNPPLNIQLALAHAEKSIRHYARFGNSLQTQAKLDARYREIAILRVATLTNCTYEWNQHLRHARRVGLTEEHIAGTKAGGGEVFTEQEKAVIRYTDEVVRKVKASDEAFAAIQSFLDPREIAELTLSVCYWEMVAKCIESLGIDPQPPMVTQ
jgi:4-carboxymuconolactone decarboxylase